MKPEELFLRYAYSCAEVQRDHLHAITDDQLAHVKEMLDDKTPVDEPFLKQVYPAAFRRLETIAKETELDPLTTETIDAYFLVYHNAFIDRRDGNYAKLADWACEFCKVHVVKITEILETGGQRAFRFSSYEPGAKILQRGVGGDLVPDAHVGDLIVIHQGWAVKKIDEQYYLGLKRKYEATKLYASLA